ncbi:hypothetical protein [Stenotrophomonas sp. SY1]|uniref:hypothetical protein n=1 Tax=Stenotrophomonas sp. SY1 TaxID=477235 RepID=UPI001E37D4D8|nr:hypothetical protein [Stenotrophomonas sp. SY1]MCD9088426.1 hypothetical protein [Stenotrophomonas sp. SY1]
MTFAFPAFHETIVSGVHTPASVAAAMRRSGWARVQEQKESVTCRVGFSAWSFGETITASFASGRLALRSSCILPTQCIDWGKNRRNILHLLDVLGT